jgi:hypothetical protein
LGEDFLAEFHLEEDIKMEKPKVLGISSENYPGGRIDSFEIDEKSGKWEKAIDCLIELGFSKEPILTKIDTILEHRGYLFLYLNQNLKVHLFAEDSKNCFTIRLDTSLPREEIIRSFEKHFELPK